MDTLLLQWTLGVRISPARDTASAWRAQHC